MNIDTSGFTLTITKEPAQTYCTCGEPLTLWYVPKDHVALPIEWVENGCQKCQFKKVTKEHRDSLNNSNE